MPFYAAASQPTLWDLPPGATLSVQVPVSAQESRYLSMQRFEVYAADARIFLHQAGEQRELPRSSQRFYLGQSGSARVMLWLDARDADAQGHVFLPDVSFDLKQQVGTWAVSRAEAKNPAGETPKFQCQSESGQQSPALSKALPALPGSGYAKLPVSLSFELIDEERATRTATVAIDVDSEAMQKKFSNNTTTATNFLAQLFVGMNASYDAPLNVQLVQGNTQLRVGSDPYGTTDDTGVQLNSFGAHWRDNFAGVPRAFAMLISGTQANGCSAAGLAWLNAYCQNGTNGAQVFGSYSVNQLFHTACANVAISNDLRITSHELGHNFGMPHTHCNNGGPLDTCFSGEGSGCYSGATSCPAGGGTLMSYCHLLGGCSASLQFHPTQITQLGSLIAANTPSCIQNAGGGNDQLFRNGFE
jgi:hypothetical protein